MRRFLGLLALLTVLGLNAGSLHAQDGAPVPAPGSDCGCNSCNDGACCPQCGKYQAYAASFGCFNCACQGSYKFPVPPQYKYFWPGMYGQRPMTSYVSPYRFPPLRLPPDMVVQPDTPAKAPTKLGRRASQASHAPSDLVKE